MKFAIWLSLISLFFICNCQSTTGQEINESIIRLAIDKDSTFTDPNIDTAIKAYVVAYVTFKDSLTLEPVQVSIQMFKMMELEHKNKNRKVDFMYVLDDSCKNSLNQVEWTLLEKYLPRVDSILMNSSYIFTGEKKWIYGKKMAIGFPFDIKPEK